MSETLDKGKLIDAIQQFIDSRPYKFGVEVLAFMGLREMIERGDFDSDSPDTPDNKLAELKKLVQVEILPYVPDLFQRKSMYEALDTLFPVELIQNEGEQNE